MNESSVWFCLQTLNYTLSIILKTMFSSIQSGQCIYICIHICVHVFDTSVLCVHIAYPQQVALYIYFLKIDLKFDHFRWFHHKIGAFYDSHIWNAKICRVFWRYDVFNKRILYIYVCTLCLFEAFYFVCLIILVERH